MGLLDKVKNLFTEEIEEEEMPIRKEVKRVEIQQPKVTRVETLNTERPVQRVELPRREEERNIDTKHESRDFVSESSALNKEENFKFPIYFDDKDFEDLPKQKAKKETKPVVKKESAYHGASPVKIEATKKKFKVSPVISPVYGVLDKNYNKDDIRIKTEKTPKRSYFDDKLTVDDIRNKAYGTLEDDLENTLFASQNEPTTKEPINSGIDIFEEIENTNAVSTPISNNDLLMHDITFEKETVTVEIPKEENVSSSLEEELEKQKQKIDELSKYINSIQTEAEHLEPEVLKEENNIIDEIVEEDKIEEPQEEIKINEPVEEIKEEENKKEAEEGDLFSLIDSMYEKRED